jgi:predicted GNAT family acetyltransferase
MDGEIVENPQGHRFEMPVGGGVAFVSYWVDGDRLVLVHTEVPPQYRGRGIGQRLARGVFDNLRKTGRKAVVRCSFLALWAKRHPEYNDIIDG